MIKIQFPLHLILASFITLLISGCTNPEALTKSRADDTEDPNIIYMNPEDDNYTKPPLPKGVDVAIDCRPIFESLDETIQARFKGRWCGKMGDDGALLIDPDVMDFIDFTPTHYSQWHSNEVACRLILLSSLELGYAYIHKEGHGRWARFQDHYCQPVKNGVFISYTNGKAGFYDEALNLVKQTHYALAEPFGSHYAKVCIERPEKKNDGIEHFSWVGGQCGYIDDNYETIVPAVHPYEATPRPLP